MSSTHLLSPLPARPSPPLPRSSSPLLACPELDLSLTVSPAHHDKPHPPRRRQKQVQFEEPPVVTVTSEPRMQGSRSGFHGHTASKGMPDTGQNNIAVVTGGGGAVVLGEAELNSTLALKAELESLQGAEFNSQKAVLENLRWSERTKQLLAARATEGVNIAPSQQLYSSLVSVTVEEHQLISQAMPDRLLAPPNRNHGNKPAESPSRFRFMTSELWREKPVLVGAEPDKPRPQPAPRPAHSSFDLYRSLTRWQA